MAITDLDLVTVAGTYLILDGSPASGTVTFTSSTILVDADD